VTDGAFVDRKYGHPANRDAEKLKKKESTRSQAAAGRTTWSYDTWAADAADGGKRSHGRAARIGAVLVSGFARERANVPSAVLSCMLQQCRVSFGRAV